MKRRLLLMSLIIAGLFGPSSVKSQAWPQEGYFLEFGLGAGWQVVSDQGLSPLHYQGYQGGFSLGYRWQKQPWQLDFKLSGTGGILQPKTSPQNRQANLFSGAFTIAFRYLTKTG